MIKHSFFVFFMIILLSFTSCEEDEVNLKPKLSTIEITDTSWTSAISGAQIISAGGSSIITVGLCWSDVSSPTIEDFNIANNDIDSINLFQITDLSPDTKYFVRAFAVNVDGLSYGNELSFTTHSLSTPDIQTVAILDPTGNSAKSGGIIISDGGSSITQKGICWSNSPSPTIESNINVAEVAGNSFSSNLTGLTMNTEYYVRAYAINSLGVGYGEEISFKTLDLIMDVDGNKYTSINIGNQVWMVENLRTTTFNDGESILHITSGSSWITTSSPAYCWVNNSYSTTTRASFGAIYNIEAITSGKLAPKGWRVPTNEDWEELIEFLGGDEIAGGKLKSDSSIWYSPNLGVTNDNLFKAHPGGYRSSYTGDFNMYGKKGLFWSSSSTNDSIYRLLLEYDTAAANFKNDSANGSRYGFNVRCIKE